ncbi:MAG: DNA phosphorothioation-dependent restriction protein DptH [Proteobacteria bacterium]|nr:DNA phosphorothioation-dependent restriction protein DptH [Pseudomonadota bacterium]
MLEKQFEDFLVEQLSVWGNQNLKAGFRYQFKSPDATNSENLLAALCKMQAGTIFDDLTALPYIELNKIKLIVVLHGDSQNSFTENYISRLRDQISSQQQEYLGSALLIIHNSMLDTIINSAEDLAAIEQIWHPSELRNKLGGLIAPLDPKKYISKCLLTLVYQQIVDNGGTIFGFISLYKALLDGDIKFGELNLLLDSKLIESDSDAQIQNRLEENKNLYERISEITERFPSELIEKLAELDFGEVFVEQYFSEPNTWRESLEFEACCSEQALNRVAGLKLEKEESSKGITLVARDKTASKAGKRERHLILVLDEAATECELTLTFTGETVEKGEIQIKDCLHKNITLLGISNSGGQRSRVKILCTQITKPTFATILLSRAKTAERYTFKVLLLQKSNFLVEEIFNNFLIVPKEQKVVLQTDENKLKISDCTITANLESIGEVFDAKMVGFVDFDKMANESSEIGFSVKSESYALDFKIEGAVASESLSLPLLLDIDRYHRLFDPLYFGIFNAAKNKIILDNQETAPKGRRLSILQWEYELVAGQLLYRSDNSDLNITCKALSDFPQLQAAYLGLFSLLENRKSLPSICGWDDEYIQCVESVVGAFNLAISTIQYNELLSKEQKKLMRLGFAVFDGNEFITPLHPMALAYFLYLAKEMRKDKEVHQSFLKLPLVTRKRLNPQGLMPFIFHPKHEFSYAQVERDNCFWLQLIPQQHSCFSYVRKLVAEKIGEFQTAFSVLFCSAPKAKLLINSVNNRDNLDLFKGLVDLVKQSKDKAPYIHVCIYDDKLEYNEFDRFSELAKHDEIKLRYELDKGKAREYADLIVDLLRSRLTYSKYENSSVSAQNYAHLTFFRNNQRIERRDVDPITELSGVVCNGLIAGEAAANDQGSYFTTFGLKGIDVEKYPHLQLALDYNRLLKPALQSNEKHGNAKSTALVVSDDFKKLLERSYDSSIWTCIIDPKVTLDFFESSKDVVLIHYSDNYTNSTNYDAITVTKHTDLYRKVLERDELGGHIEEFNAFNGEWLLKMITDNANERKAKRGIIGAYKYINSLLAHSDITWVPLSMAEIIRVAPNVGLKISESDFSRSEQGFKKGAISDDVLFAGFKGDKVYLLPVEVKTGKRQMHAKGLEQAKELKRYLSENLLGKADFAGGLYRGLFARQVLMQVDKYKLYDLYEDNYFDELTENREWWMKGEYSLGELLDYPEGFLFVNVEDATFFDAQFTEDERILKVEIPAGFLGHLIRTPLHSMLENAKSESLFHIPEKYLLTAALANGSEALESIAEHAEDLFVEAKSVTIPAVEVIATQHQPLQVLFGHDAYSQKSLIWEPTNTSKFMNTNTGIIGTMGTGKTQFTKSLVTQLMRNQHKNVDSGEIGLLIFDYKSDYIDNDFSNANTTKRYKLHRLPYNPLSLYGDMPMLPVHTATGFAETMAKAFGLGQKQQLRLRKLILDAYELAGISKSDSSTWNRAAPTIANLWDLFLEQEKVEQDSLYAALDSLATYEIFESDPDSVCSLYDLLDGVRVIELAGYSSQIQNLVVALTLDLFYSQMQKRGKPIVNGDYRQITKLILVDEADNFMKEDFAALRKILKEGREYGVGVILSTQDITHFKTGENNYASYVLTWVIHRVAEIRNADIKAIFNIDDKGEQESLMETIRKLEKHFSLYIDGDKKITKIRDKAFWELEIDHN